MLFLPRAATNHVKCQTGGLEGRLSRIPPLLLDGSCNRIEVEVLRLTFKSCSHFYHFFLPFPEEKVLSPNKSDHTRAERFINIFLPFSYMAKLSLILPCSRVSLCGGPTLVRCRTCSRLRQHPSCTCARLRQHPESPQRGADARLLPHVRSLASIRQLTSASVTTYVTLHLGIELCSASRTCEASHMLTTTDVC